MQQSWGSHGWIKLFIWCYMYILKPFVCKVCSLNLKRPCISNGKQDVQKTQKHWHIFSCTPFVHRGSSVLGVAINANSNFFASLRMNTCSNSMFHGHLLIIMKMANHGSDSNRQEGYIQPFDNSLLWDVHATPIFLLILALSCSRPSSIKMRL